MSVRYELADGDPAYRVGTDGNIWTRHLPGSKIGTLTDQWIRMDPEKSNRYPAVRLYGRKRYVHDMVLRAFVGPPSEGQEALHWNDAPYDNHLWNLRWGTRKENLADRKRNREEIKEMEDYWSRRWPKDEHGNYVQFPNTEASAA